MMSDIEIAQKATMKPIGEIAAKLGIPESAVEPFGRTKAKIRLDYIDTLRDRPDGKLVLVTAISPTPAGEGKTTTTVGLGDALNHIGKKATRRWCRWRTSTCTSRGTSTRSRWPTTCWRR